MSDYLYEDYDIFKGKSIIVIYECGHKYKKLHCKLLGYCEKNPKERFVILKAPNNTIYNINCDNIIYIIAEYSDTLTQNVNANESTDTKLYKVNTCALDEHIPCKAQQNEEINTLDSIHNSTPNISIASSENTIDNSLLEYITSNSKDEDSFDPSLNSNNNEILTNIRGNANHILPKAELNQDEIIIDNKDNHGYNIPIDYYSKQNNTISPLAAFINSNFQGVHLTIYTTSTETISGEVAFNYDYLVALKSDEKTYYINPHEITYFF